MNKKFILKFLYVAIMMVNIKVSSADKALSTAGSLAFWEYCGQTKKEHNSKDFFSVKHNRINPLAPDCILCIDEIKDQMYLQYNQERLYISQWRNTSVKEKSLNSTQPFLICLSEKNVNQNYNFNIIQICHQFVLNSGKDMNCVKNINLEFKTGAVCSLNEKASDCDIKCILRSISLDSQKNLTMTYGANGSPFINKIAFKIGEGLLNDLLKNDSFVLKVGATELAVTENLYKKRLKEDGKKEAVVEGVGSENQKDENDLKADSEVTTIIASDNQSNDLGPEDDSIDNQIIESGSETDSDESSIEDQSNYGEIDFEQLENALDRLNNTPKNKKNKSSSSDDLDFSFLIKKIRETASIEPKVSEKTTHPLDHVDQSITPIPATTSEPAKKPEIKNNNSKAVFLVGGVVFLASVIALMHQFDLFNQFGITHKLEFMNKWLPEWVFKNQTSQS